MEPNERPFRIRPIDHGSDAEIALVAARMRDTLIEVLGRERGESMYTMEWLMGRARFHLDANACVGEILLAESSEGEIVGHTILRVESSFGEEVGLFSTLYVAPSHRRLGAARALLSAGEEWLVGQGMSRLRTNTHPENAPLIYLFEGFGYKIVETVGEFAVLVKHL